jgi:hypothetical protein
MRRCDDVSRWRGDTGEGKEGDDASWADMNFTKPKKEENPHDLFSYFK